MPKHLTDDQLLELEDIHQPHLTNCDYCQQRQQYISQIRNKLTAMPLLQAPAIIEQKINAQLFAKQPSIGQSSASIKKGFMWRTMQVSLAASIVVMVAISWWRVTAPPITEDVYSALVLMIEKNNQVFSENNNDNGKPAVFIDMQFDDDLSGIETAIQNAYLNNSSPQKKLRLWEQRHELLTKIKQSQMTTTQHQI
jgi:hypothetical protein